MDISDIDSGQGSQVVSALGSSGVGLRQVASMVYVDVNSLRSDGRRLYFICSRGLFIDVSWNWEFRG